MHTHAHTHAFDSAVLYLLSFFSSTVIPLFLFQDELKLALKQGTTLLGCIKEQAAKSENHKLNPDEMENQTTVER